MRKLIPLALFACPAETATPPATPKLDELAHTWKVQGHVLTATAVMSDIDADALDGRVVEITKTGYTTPWHGTCESATRERRGRTLADVATSQRLSADARDKLATRLAGDLFEVRLGCADNKRAPELLMWVADKTALTCWNGVCYVLAHE